MERRILKLREETVADPWEYEMARSVSSEENMQQFNVAAGELQTSLGQLFQLRESPKSAETPSVKKIDDVEEMSLLTTGMASVAMMKKYNRMEKMLLKKSRDQVADARQRVDKQHLQFRNMMYELQYLRTEISKCLDHKSASDEIELIPEEQFFAEAPAGIARPEVTRDDPHELWKARLEYELEQRKSFKQQHSNLEKQKKLILARIKQRKISLDSLLPKLKEVIEVTKPLQEPMGIPKEKILRHADFLKIFPLPMYILYCRIKAYKDAYEPSLMLDIFGDIDELAKQMKDVSKEVAPAPIEIDESELDSQEVSESHVDRDTERRISVSSQQEDVSVTTKLRVTIQVAFDLKEGDANGQMKLLFSYFPKLNIMSVCSTFSSASEGPAISSGDDLLRSSNLLAYLYPSDSGDKMPTLASELILTGKGIDFADVFAEDRPYVWVQLLAGIDVTAENIQPVSTLNLKKDLISTDFEKILKDIRLRVATRVSLQKTLSEIEARHFVVRKEYQPHFAARIVTTVSRLVPTDWAEASVRLSHRSLFRTLAENSGFFYKTEVKSGKVGVVAYIMIPFDFPSSRVLFFLEWSNSSEHNDPEHLADIEREVNVNLFLDLDVQHNDSLLLQLETLRQSIDVVSAYDAVEKGLTVEASGTKVFQMDVNSRIRSLPLKYQRETKSFELRY